MAILKVLHLVGSATDQFYADLSRLYAQDCIEATADPARYEFLIAYVSPDRHWRFPKSLDPSDIAAAAVMSFPEAIQFLVQQQPDVALPQMFCVAGMTEYRSLLDLLGIPFVGNSGSLMAIAADKAKTKAIVAAAGVSVPQGELLHRGDTPTIIPPAIVKPTTADNSLGVTLVHKPEDYAAALEEAFKHSDAVLVETYIPLGREVRCGIVVQGGDQGDEQGNDRGRELVGLPLEEYRMDAQQQPIRAYANKLKQNDQGNLDFAAKDGKQSWIVEADDPDMPAVWEAAKRCHRALGCRHYSLFDFRIDPEGKPWFIEAGLYCSFAPKSVISSMMKAAGTSLDDFFETMLKSCWEAGSREV